MIPGVLSQRARSSSSSFGGTFDFVNGTYSWQGTEITAADLIDRTDWIGTSGGLNVPASQAAGAQILYAPLIAYLSTFQVAFSCEVNVKVADPKAVILYFGIGPGGEDTQFNYDAGFGTFDNGTSNSRAPSDSNNAQSDGIWRACFQRIDASEAVSVMGALPNVSPDGTLDNTLLTMPSIVSPKYFLGGFDTSTNNAFDIHWIKFFDPILTPAQMAVLSA